LKHDIVGVSAIHVKTRAHCNSIKRMHKHMRKGQYLVICCVDCIRFVYEMSTRCRLLLVWLTQPTQRNRMYMKLSLLMNFLRFLINCKHFHLS